MNDSSSLSSALSSWRAYLGDRAVLTRDAASRAYAPCTTGVERVIPAALRPTSVDDVVAIVNIARIHSVPLYPISTGHNWGYGTANPPVDGCVIVDLSALDRIIAMDSELGLVTLEPGVTQRGLRDYLDRNHHSFLVPVTGAGPTCSLVGNALERGYGITPYADHFSAATSIEAVLPDGRIYRSVLSELGGETVDRAFKWGLGPHLDGLFAQGNFGIVTQMTIALAPRPERIEAFLFTIDDDSRLEAAVIAVRTILREIGGVTGSINLMNARRLLAMAIAYPDHRVGDAGILPEHVVAEIARANRVTAWTGIGALYGKADVVRAARRAIRQILKPVANKLTFLTPAFASRLKRVSERLPYLRHSSLARKASMLDATLRLISGEPSQIALRLAYWKSGTPPAAGAEMDPARDGCGLIWYPPLVPMKPDCVRQYVKIVESVCAAHGVEPLITLTSLSDRCFDSSIPLLFDRADPEKTARAQSCYRALLETGRAEGFLPYRLSTGSMPAMMVANTPYWDLVARIKAGLDPNGIIAPGRYSPVEGRQPLRN